MAEVLREQLNLALAETVRCDDLIYVLLSDGRLVTYPLTERLRRATPQQRRNCHVADGGTALRWPDVDEDLGLNTILGVAEEALLKLADKQRRRQDRFVDVAARRILKRTDW